MSVPLSYLRGHLVRPLDQSIGLGGSEASREDGLGHLHVSADVLI